MRQTLLTLLLLAGLTNFAFAGNGYRVGIKFTDVNLADSQVYLAHYYGKPLPTIYKIDSARFDKTGMAILQSKDTIVGGIYIVLLSDKKTYFEFLLNNGDDISITAKASELPVGLNFKNSPENDRFISYIRYLGEYSLKQQQYQQELAKAKTKTDSVLVFEKSAAEGKLVTSYRTDYVAKYPGSLLANIFNAMEVPKVPEGKHYLPDGKVDSMFPYDYYRAHYWDKFDFRDDRLVLTPIYDSKLDEYFNKVIPQIPDTFSAEADKLLEKTRGTKELFKYTLHNLAQFAQYSKIMGMDEAFIHLVENYYMKGDAYWLSSDMLAKYVDRAQKIAPNVIGNVAPELKMIDLENKEHSLLGLKAKYTLLIFWSPTCGSCLEEVPKLDSLYRAVLKDKGVRIFAVRTDSDLKIWKEKIDKLKINDWVNVYDPKHTSNYRDLYDVYGTPTVYLLDERKIIQGRRVGHENILQLIEILESGHTPNSQKKS
ncbi:thioredoxin-like domain-containing protein [Polluticoccus soli]|uniref:thioredoxin-like domain-containing protein n=1 Tax=Polluticoccus soli TaxID=3034150 RepID=UPI0023E0D823|nr:thioredoxin-like domain-containing protein [Flavipsychrobacter sp. JY13-12]